MYMCINLPLFVGVLSLTLVRKNPNIQRISRLAAMQKEQPLNGGSSGEIEGTNIRFANESPFLLISSVSVKDLSDRISGGCSYLLFFIIIILLLLLTRYS